MNLDSILWLSGTVTELAVIGVLAYRRIWQTFPLFFVYNLESFVGSIALYSIFRIHVKSYEIAYLAFILVDAIVLFAVLVELGTSVLRPLRDSLPRITPVILALLIFVLGAVIWPFSAFPGAMHLSTVAAAVTHTEQDLSVLRVLTFLVLVGFSQFLSIGWRDREFQIAAGLGFYSLVGLAVAVLHSHQTTRVQYSRWSRVEVVSYVCMLIYWIISFAQSERARREFTPQMQHVLLAVAGQAHSTRAAMAQHEPKETREKIGRE